MKGHGTPDIRKLIDSDPRIGFTVSLDGVENVLVLQGGGSPADENGSGRLTYRDRKTTGDKAEARVKKYLESRFGFQVFPHGMALLPDAQVRELIARSDNTTKAIRFEPDFWIPIPGQCDSFLVDPKSQDKSTHTNNFSVNFGEHEYQRRKINDGCQILWVFATNNPTEPLYAAWLQDLDNIINWEFGENRYKASRGSRKKYGLICKFDLQTAKRVLREHLDKYSWPRGVRCG